MASRATVLERISLKATTWAGSSLAFAFALGTIIVWAATGPIFNFSDTWQLVINTGTTIVTFIMVFLIQRSQNKESMAVQLKLNELVAAMGGASNRLINIENLSEKDITLLRKHYRELVKLARDEGDLTSSHSVEEARDRHELKKHIGQGVSESGIAAH